jgi:hypothetical protein
LTHFVGEPKLVIVRRGHFATYELLTRAFAGDAAVQVIWDRRGGERRQAPPEPGTDDRRLSDRRRTARTLWGPLDYMVATETSA